MLRGIFIFVFGEELMENLTINFERYPRDQSEGKEMLTYIFLFVFGEAATDGKYNLIELKRG